MQKTKTSTQVKTWAAIVLFIAAAVLSAVFMGKVAINYNLADYLGEDTQTKIALDIIEDEFGMTGNIQVMVKNVDGDTAKDIADILEDIPNVLNVNFDRYDETYYKDDNALFIVIIDGDDYSEAAKQVSADIKVALASYDGAEYGGTTVEKAALQDAIVGEMVYILAISLCLVVAILLITSESWLEPFILLLASGAAVLINRGTNVFFGEISYITNSIAAILQLALSIDYSIVLLHAYRRKKETEPDRGAAMKAAILSVVKPVSASALTTVAGLLALLFMSFRIGFDIGIVLIKGIVISAVTALTLLPALVMLFDRPLTKTKKAAFVPKGHAFCRIAERAGKVIVPVALILSVLAGVLQTGNRYLFTDTKSGNAAINDVFGNNNSVVVVYRNSENNSENEKTLADRLYAYRTADGKTVLTNYTAYSNTVRDLYDVTDAVHKLDISEDDARLLFTMYNLYRVPETTKMTFAEFVSYARLLTKTDADAADFTDADTEKTLDTLLSAVGITTGEWTADELYEKMTTGVLEDTDIRLFSVKQLYGMYFYDTAEAPSVDFLTMVNYIVSVSSDENLAGMMSEKTVSDLKLLSFYIRLNNAQMEAKTEKGTFKSKMESGYGLTLTDEAVDAIYAAYYAASGADASETPSYLPLFTFAVQAGFITDATAAADCTNKNRFYAATHGAYTYEEFPEALLAIATAATGTPPEESVSADEVQQIYIMYFYQNETLKAGKLTGYDFATYALKKAGENSVVGGQLTEQNKEKLSDMLTVHRYMTDGTQDMYEAAYRRMSDLKSEIKSDMTTPVLDKDKISGVYIKYAAKDGGGLLTPMMACDLLDFVSDRMDTNTLLMEKMSAENREKVADARADVDKAEDLFLGENHSRMLLSVDLPNESEETTAFVRYLSDEVKTVFGSDAYITGEIVSTYDLESAFSHDNLFITVFTLVSIFLIVMLIFRSLSLPVILVAVIQGAIFIAMSTQLFGHGIFFMSYIVSTCILMGATIDYGILMSTNYVAYRATCDKKTALVLSVGAAMPTVFSSGLILTVCGFVIHFISSQNSISTVGLLLGIGAICSVVMITVVLPSILYIADGFVMRLSMKKKK